METHAARQYWTTVANAIMQLDDVGQDIHKIFTLQAYDGASAEADDDYIPDVTFHDEHANSMHTPP